MVQLFWRRALLALGPALVGGLLAFGVYRYRHPDPTGIAAPPLIAKPVRPAFPLSLAPGQRYLVGKNGAPFLIQGEAAWSLIAQLTLPEAELYLEDRRRRGFNLLIVNLIEHWFSDHPPLDANGLAPFEVPWDFSSENPEYFRHAKEMIRLARDKGFVVLLCPAYLGGDGSPEGFYAEMRRSGPEKLRQYGEYVGALMRDLDNVIWLAGGDYTPPAASLELVDAVQQGIKLAAPEQLQVGHWSPETSGLDVKLRSTKLDFNTTYTYLPAYLNSLRDYDHGNGAAHFLIESKYEGDLLGTTQRWLRAQAYYALLTGAMGQVYGNRWVWTFTVPTLWNRLSGRNWKRSLDSPGARSMGFVRLLFEKLPWTRLVPDQTFEILTSGQGSRGSPEYPVLSWTRDGRLALAYVPRKPIDVELGRLVGPVRARWYDPTNGQFIDVPGSPLPAKARSFSPPGRNSAGDQDWVLVLDTVPSEQPRSQLLGRGELAK